MMTSSKIRQNMEITEITITFDLQIVEKWLTPHLICKLYIENMCVNGISKCFDARYFKRIPGAAPLDPLEGLIAPPNPQLKYSATASPQ